MVDRSDWVDFVLTFKDAKYLHQGRSIEGMDCPAPLILAARHFGIVAPDFDVTAYPREPDGSLQPFLDEHLERKPRHAMTLGDVVLNAFRMKKPRHLAIIVGERWGQWELLHASADAGKVQIERIQYGRYYRYVQGYGVPGIV